MPYMPYAHNDNPTGKNKPCDGCPFANQCPLFGASAEFQVILKQRWASLVPCGKPENAEIWEAHKARQRELRSLSVAFDLATTVVQSKAPALLN